MPTYSFRLRFNFSDSYRIASDATELALLTKDEVSLTLKSGATKSSLKETPRAAVLGGPFATKEKAQDAAKQAKRSILFWAVEQRVGVDFGDGRQRNQLTAEGIRYFEEQYGRPIRLDRQGIDIFETLENATFIYTSLDGQVEKSVEAFIKTFQREFPTKREITEKQVLASEIYSSSFFDIGQRSRLITLVTAVEALLVCEKRGTDVQILVDEFSRLTAASDIDSSIRQSICGSLDWIRYESIGRAGRALADYLLLGGVYDGKSAGAFFTKAYSLRSSLVHRGTPDKDTDMLEMANATEEFVAHLLLASLS